MGRSIQRAFLLIAAIVALPQTASAFSVRVHIHLANVIRQDLVDNMNASKSAQNPEGIPRIRLLGPDGQAPRYVRIPLEDARVIRDYPEFWRGGAIGPDNTVAPGLTDPSHIWAFQPFSQCNQLVEGATQHATECGASDQTCKTEAGQERAYALACFLHGITDNNAHHLVNFFTGETFTLTPAATAQNGELQWSMLNVVRHIVTEHKFEASLLREDPGALAPEMMRHRIATKLYRRVFLGGEGHDSSGLWHYFIGDLVERKNAAILVAQLNGVEPPDGRSPNARADIAPTIEHLRQQGVRVDRRMIDAYIDFLKTGAPVDLVHPGQLAPADYILLLPEIVDDMKRFLEITRNQGVADLTAEQGSDGRCGLIEVKCKLLSYLFAPGDDGSPSKFDQVLERKNRELDNVVGGYVQSVENLSNLMVTTGLEHATPTDIRTAILPLTTAIDGFTAFDYDVLFPHWLAAAIDQLSWLRGILDATFSMIKDAVKERIVDFLVKHLEEIKTKLRELEPDWVLQLAARLDDVKRGLMAQVDAATLRAVGLELAPAQGLLDHFKTSVLYMNAFNSVAGVMANREVAFRTDATPRFGGGPFSYDASYQVRYNQLSLCDELRPAFYPCGTSAAEMLQPDYHTCRPFPESARLDPPIECHDNALDHFAERPNPEMCTYQTMDELLAYDNGHGAPRRIARGTGSYTGAFPPELLDDQGPECIHPLGEVGGSGPAGSGDFERQSGGLGGEGSGGFFGSEGCRIGSAGRPDHAALGLFALAALALAVRRRRR